MGIALGLAIGIAAIPGARPATAQAPPPHGEWRTFRTEHFRVTYPEGLEERARHAAARAELAWERLASSVTRPPRAPVDLLLTDHTDISNGFANVFPSNRIVLHAAPPADHLALGFHDDWLDLLVVHELAHVFHLDRTGALGRTLRRVFGRVPAGWPFFPGVGTPIWSVEGLATYIESRFTGFGRVHGSYHEMVLRTAALADRLEPIDRGSGQSPLWPGGSRPYIYGSLFHHHLQERHGAGVASDLVDRTADALIPPWLAFDRIARRATGTPFTEEWELWRADVRSEAAVRAEELARHRLTEAEPLTAAARYQLHPRTSPDGGRLAWSSEDGRTRPSTRVLDLATGEIGAWGRRNQGSFELGPASWLPDGSGVVYSQYEFRGAYRLHQDLYALDASGRERRLTRGARVSDPDVHPAGGRAVAVQELGGSNRLVAVDLASGEVRALTRARPDRYWSLPRWSPDGGRIAASLWRHGGTRQVVILDGEGAIVREVTGGISFDGAPAWSPDGRWLVFASDRTGISNLYALDLNFPPAAGEPRGGGLPGVVQLTNVATGAFYPDVSRDGWLYFSRYGPEGFDLARIPFRPEDGREPMPADARFALDFAPGARAAEHDVDRRTDRGIVPREVAPRPSPTETAGGESRGYSALPTLLPRFWIPLVEDRGVAGTFFGAFTGGRDLVGRHSYDVGASIQPDHGRVHGRAAYRWSGLGNPLLDASLSRSWGSAGLVVVGGADTLPLLARDDVARLSTLLLLRGWRRSASLRIGAEAELEHHEVSGREDLDASVFDRDRMGVFGSIGYADATRNAFSISPEDGVSLTVGARRRWEIDPDPEAEVDARDRELFGQASGYLGLPLPGFARHVIAGRGSGLWRAGPAAGLSSLGGASGGVEDLGVASIGGGTIFLPVRGFAEGTRRGTRGWTASGEYRFPIALVARGYRLWPVFLDRVSGSGFVDAGHIWCTDPQLAFRRGTVCTPRGDPPLVSAGGELSFDVTLFYSAPLRLRTGVAVPIRHRDDEADGPIVYLRLGPSF